jgi:hypothetical protein
MHKNRFASILFILLLAVVTLSVQAQKRVALTAYNKQSGNTAGLQAIESTLKTMLVTSGYQVSADSTSSDLKINFTANFSSSNNSGSFTFVYVNAEAGIFDVKTRSEISHMVFDGVKGAGVNVQSATQKAYQAAARKIADSTAQLLRQSRPLAVNKPAETPVVKLQPSDVDLNIPETALRNDRIYALIIGNEDYKSYQQGLNDEVNVDFAVQDATIFKTYVQKTLGVPDENIKLLLNARSIDMHREIKKLVSYIKALNGAAEIIFFYAGHGLPDETTKEPYLIPVDVVGTDLQFAVKLNGIYADLTAYPAKKVTLFIDACFTGGARNQGLIAARGVKVKPKTDVLQGNIVIFSASSGDQSSMAYKEKNHGMFTYYLLKKIRESKGNINYKELSDYLSREVAVQSVRVNNKEQNPQVSFGEDVRDQWGMWRLKD